MKNIIIYLIYCILINLPFFLFSQTTKELNGRVVEMSTGKAQGIGDIKVSIKDISYNITNGNGDFSLQVPSDKDFVKINLENTTKQLISPYSGLINLPAIDRVEVIVCAQENTRLRDEVDKLKTKVKSFQGKYELSEKKAAKVYKEMLDTIVHYELYIQNLDAEKSKIKTELTSEIQRLQTEIERLKSVESALMQQLLATRDTLFKQKQAHFQTISAGLRRYADELQNLNDMLLPERLKQYFAYNANAAIDKLGDRINAYNKSFQDIYDNKDAHITEVKHYWEDEKTARQLTDTYTYLLEDVHKKTVYPMEFTVNESLKKFLSKQLGRRQAERQAKESATDAISKIRVKNTLLLDKINQTINQLNQDF